MGAHNDIQADLGPMLLPIGELRTHAATGRLPSAPPRSRDISCAIVRDAMRREGIDIGKATAATITVGATSDGRPLGMCGGQYLKWVNARQP